MDNKKTQIIIISILSIIAIAFDIFFYLSFWDSAKYLVQYIFIIVCMIFVLSFPFLYWLANKYWNKH